MKQLEQQQNFQGEVTTGYVMHLIKLTLENVRLARQPINNKGETMKKKMTKKKQPNILKGLKIEVLTDDKKAKNKFEKGLSQFLLNKFQQGYFN